MARKDTSRRWFRRATPRRWLPFLAFAALVAGAAVVESDPAVLQPAELDASLDVATLPAVPARDAISTAWYCAGGSAQGDGGIAELTAVMANDADEGATAEVTVIDAAGSSEVVEVDIPANGRARLRAAEVLEADWVALLVEVRGGRVTVDREVVGPLGFDAQPCSSEAADQWWVPSGSSVRGSRYYVSLFNPFPDAASVDITFATNSGARTPVALRGFSVPARSVRVIPIHETITDRSAIATNVAVRSGRITVDRVQTFDGTGEDLLGVGDGPVTTPAPRGLVSTPASPVRAERWIVPSGRLTAGVRTQVAIFNPSRREAEVDVVITYEEPERNPSVEPIELTIRAKEQTIVDLTDLPGIQPDANLAIDVRSLDGEAVVAERISYFGEPAPRVGVAVAAGQPMAATRWMVGQAGTTQTRTATVQVFNPGPADAQITVEQLDGTIRADLAGAAITVPAGDRRSLDLSDAGPAASVVVTADQPVVVGSSLSLNSGEGIGIAPAFSFTETVVALPPFT